MRRLICDDMPEALLDFLLDVPQDMTVTIPSDDLPPLCAVVRPRGQGDTGLLVTAEPFAVCDDAVSAADELLIADAIERATVATLATLGGGDWDADLDDVPDLADRFGDGLRFICIGRGAR